MTTGARSPLDRPLVLVTGKGGAGKTTVAASLAVAAATRGRRTIVCEVSGQHRLAEAFGAGPPYRAEQRLGQRLWTSSIDPQDALREWLGEQPGGALAVSLLTRSRAFGQFVEAAPGAKEVVTVGKIVDLAHRTHAPYDLVVLDAPSTGHALAMLTAPHRMHEIAPVGPIGRQAEDLHAFLTDPASTAYVGVCLPEEMPMREVLELEDGLRAAMGRGLDLIAVNAVAPAWFTDAQAHRLQTLVAQGVATPLLQPELVQQRRARTHADRVQWLRDHTATPVVTLPFVFGAEVGPTDYARFARRLRQA